MILTERFIKLTMYGLLILVLGCKGIAQEDVSTGSALLCDKAVDLATIQDLDPLVEMVKGKRLVLLGESTHGTHEYYHWRAEISKRLITEAGFSFIAVEGDWMPIYRLNLYVKGMLQDEGVTATEILMDFNRWPPWMWGNRVIAELAEWLRDYNLALPVADRVGFYGMDVYGQWEAMDEVLRVAKLLLPDDHEKIADLYSCYTAFGRDEWMYARAVMQGVASCDDRLLRVVDLFRAALAKSDCDDTRKLLWHGKQSAKVVMNSEDFYRLAVRGDNNGSWNSRVGHMDAAVDWLLDQHGEGSRGIVWAHNTHIGDARATDMHPQGRVNIGQLSRERHGVSGVFAIGFSTFTGRVNAGSGWGAPMSLMQIPKARSGSVEAMLDGCGRSSFFVVMDEAIQNDSLLNLIMGHRAIGVVFNPETEHLYNYVPTILPKRYDAMIFIRETKPLIPVK